MSQSPLQKVRAQYGSKEELAKKVVDLLEKPEDEETEAFEHRVQTMSNRKLLRLIESHEAMTAKYGSKAALVEAVVKARFSGGNADYAAKIDGYSVPRLLDLARQAKV